MELTRDEYRVQYDETSGIITCQGSLRLRGGKEDQAILDLLTQAAGNKPEVLTLDVRELKFLNSAGINLLAKLILQVREHKASQVVIQGSRQYPWQQKSLINFQRLLPELKLEID